MPPNFRTEVLETDVYVVYTNPTTTINDERSRGHSEHSRGHSEHSQRSTVRTDSTTDVFGGSKTDFYAWLNSEQFEYLKTAQGRNFLDSWICGLEPELKAIMSTSWPQVNQSTIVSSI